ncbi:MAG: hypothetical protein M3Y48_08225 [Actinomycetota bacterium]|nr:hypothetical protein [Actinomycetota bacterium]
MWALALDIPTEMVDPDGALAGHPRGSAEHARATGSRLEPQPIFDVRHAPLDSSRCGTKTAHII